MSEKAAPPATAPITEKDMEPVREVGLCCFCQLPIYDTLDDWGYGQPVNRDTNEPAIWHNYCHDHPKGENTYA